MKAAANRCYLDSFGSGCEDVVGMLCSEVLNCPEAGAATFNPVLDERGDVTHVVEMWRDITVRAQLEAQLGHREAGAARRAGRADGARRFARCARITQVLRPVYYAVCTVDRGELCEALCSAVTGRGASRPRLTAAAWSPIAPGCTPPRS